MTRIVLCMRLLIPMSRLRSSNHLQGILSLVKHVIIIQLHIIFSKTWNTQSFLVCSVSSDPLTPNIASNSRVVTLDLNLSMDISTNVSQFFEIHGSEGDVVQYNSR